MGSSCTPAARVLLFLLPILQVELLCCLSLRSAVCCKMAADSEQELLASPRPPRIRPGGGAFSCSAACSKDIHDIPLMGEKPCVPATG